VIDPQKLLEFVEKRAREANPSDAPLLVQHAIYEGLANRIKNGEFDSEFRDPPDGWFMFGSHADRPFEGPLEFSTETDDAGMPLWERHTTRKDADR
jgi:hypothetical protein